MFSNLVILKSCFECDEDRYLADRVKNVKNNLGKELYIIHVIGFVFFVVVLNRNE